MKKNNVKETINQYLNLIKNLTNQDMEINMSDEIEKILMKGNNFEYAKKLADHIESTKERIIKEKVIPELEIDGFELSHSTGSRSGKGDFSFYYTKPKWKENNICIFFGNLSKNLCKWHF